MARNFDQQDDQYDPSYVKTIQNYLEPENRVLDFACGTGAFSCLIASDVQKICAIDISSKMLEVAERKAAEREVRNIDFLHATIFDERLAAGSFDVVLAFNILHLLADTPQVIQRINTLLQPGGYFISDTPCLGEKKSLLGMVTSLISKIGFLPHVESVSIAGLKSAIINGNFQIVETRNLSPSPPTLLIIAKKI